MIALINGFRNIRLLAGVLVLLSACLSLSANGEFLGLEQRLINLYKEHQSAMVRVKAVYPPEGDEEVPQVVIGSGFFISREGLIITNASIVSRSLHVPLRVWVEHNQIAYSAEVLGLDQRANVAFLRTHTLPEDFSFFHLMDRADLPPIGSFIFRLSMPLEFEASPYFGMVSGYESRFGEAFFPCTYMRTTIPVRLGDGGSAFLDLTGRLLGIQVGSLPDVGSSYVLPARAALRIRDDILFSGMLTYGWIGFEVEVISSIENGRQIVLSDIIPDTPASEVGLMEGDVLLQIGEYPIESLDQLRNAMFYTRVGQYVDVQVQRGGEIRLFSVRTVARPADEPMEIRAREPDPEDIQPIKGEPEEEPEGTIPFGEDTESP